MTRVCVPKPPKAHPKLLGVPTDSRVSPAKPTRPCLRCVTDIFNDTTHCDHLS